MFKRTLDILLSFLFLIIFSPAMVALAVVIFIKMGRPVLFKQMRPGYKAKPFYLYKFRTMNYKRDNGGKLLSDDLRLTPLGRFLRKYSLDELPQLFNIIKGELSFVGPRPLLMSYLEKYNEDQSRRHEVKPGITGWAQINGRNAISWEERFKLDVWYVDNRSLLIDLKILGITIIKVLKAEGISGEGSLTMKEFNGSNE